MKKIRYVEINSIVVSMAIQFFDDVKVDAKYRENNVKFYWYDGTFSYLCVLLQMVMDIKNGLLYFCGTVARRMKKVARRGAELKEKHISASNI